MATNSMVPYSNPAGNNQTTPGAGAAAPTNVLPKVISGTGPAATLNPASVAAGNPLIPTSTAAAVNVPNAGSTMNNNPNTQQQLSDIYGSGVGTDLTNLLGSIGGTNSATLQEYNQSLAPQEAVASANLDASLGAGGVSSNSSVAALGQANLQAQETAAIAGEDANLTQSGQSLEASILTGTEQAASQEVASSGWDVFGQVLSGIGADAGGIMKGISSFSLGNSVSA